MQSQESSNHRSVTSFYVPQDRTYFVNVVNKTKANKHRERSAIRGFCNYGWQICESKPSLSCLNQKIRFIHSPAFSYFEKSSFCKLIHNLAQRNIAVISREEECTTLCAASAENRRKSFYKDETKEPVHPHFWESRIEDFVTHGFFLKPSDMKPRHPFPSPPDSADATTNISFAEFACLDAYIADWDDDVETELKKITKPVNYQETCQILSCPVMELNETPHPAVISTVHTMHYQTNSMLIRQKHVKLPMLSLPDIINLKLKVPLQVLPDILQQTKDHLLNHDITKYIQTLLLKSHHNNPDSDAESNPDLYISIPIIKKIIENDIHITCQEVIDTCDCLNANLTDFEKNLSRDIIENRAISETDINKLLSLIVKTKRTISFSKSYLEKISPYMASIIAIDTIHSMLKSKNSEYFTKIEQLKDDLMTIEKSALKQALSENIEKKENTHYALFLYNSIFTSLTQLTLEFAKFSPIMGEQIEILNKLKDKSTAINTISVLQSTTICSLRCMVLVFDEINVSVDSLSHKIDK